MSGVGTLARLPRASFEFANVILTIPDAAIGQTPREVVWTHRGTTLYRYRSSRREHAIPVLLVFALIDRPEIFDLRPGNSFVEFLLADGFDVFLVDWGVPGEEDSGMGLAEFVCDELHWAVREALLTSGEEELTLLGWCIGGTLCAMYCALHPVGAVRNAILLTTPIDPSDSLYARWVGHDDFDVDLIADSYPAVPGAGIDLANKLMKPVTNYMTTYRRLFQSILDGRVRLRGQRVGLARIEQNLLVVTAGADHIAPPAGTVPLLDLVSSEDVTYLDRPGGHIGLMAGSKAKNEIWPELADWLSDRSGH